MNYFENKSVLIAGGSGLLGMALVAKLRLLSAQMTATYHLNEPPRRFQDVHYISRDLTSPLACQAACSGQDFVFMCAASVLGAAGMADKSSDLITGNITMVVNMLKAAKGAGVRKIMLFGSTTSYPESNLAMSEDDLFVDDPADMYFGVGWMKRYTAKLCQYWTRNGLPALLLIPSNIYGPFDQYLT